MRPARPTPRRRARTGAAAAGSPSSPVPSPPAARLGGHRVRRPRRLDLRGRQQPGHGDEAARRLPRPDGAELDDVDSVAGKTVYYVPITQQAPQFTVTEEAVAAAVRRRSASTCRSATATGPPTDIGGCISQATDAKAAAIITDAIPYALAANALDAAQTGRHPGRHQQPGARPVPPGLQDAHLGAGPRRASSRSRLFDWIASDSEGKANVLVNQSSDGLSPASYVADGKAALTKSCPDCKLTINEVSSSNFALIPSSTSSALLKDPDASATSSPSSTQYLQPTQGGVQQAGRVTDIKVVTGAAHSAA